MSLSSTSTVLTTGVAHDSLFARLIRIPICPLVYIGLFVLEDLPGNWPARVKALASWLTGAPHLSRRFFRTASAIGLLDPSDQIAKLMYGRSCALVGDVETAMEVFTKHAPPAPGIPKREEWQTVAIASLVRAGRPDLAAHLEYIRFGQMGTGGGERVLLRSALLYADALSNGTIDMDNRGYEATIVLRRTLRDTEEYRERLPDVPETDWQRIESTYWELLERRGYWDEILLRLNWVQSLDEVDGITRRRWRRALRGAAAKPEQIGRLPDRMARYYNAQANCTSTTDVERHDWLLCAASISMKSNQLARARVACSLALGLLPDPRDLGDSVWSAADRAAIASALAPLPVSPSVGMGSIAGRFTSARTDSRAQLLSDELLTEADEDREVITDKLWRIGEALLETNYPAHHILRDLVAAAESWSVPEVIPKLEEWLGDRAKEARHMEQVPKGLHPVDQKEYAAILARIEQARDGGRTKREDIERLIELTMDIVPPESRVEHLVSVACTALAAGYGAMAESCLLGARKSCTNYDDIASRCKMFLRLTSALERTTLGKPFPLLCESVFREGRNTARNTAVLGSGYLDEEREELRHTARLLDESWGRFQRFFPDA